MSGLWPVNWLEASARRTGVSGRLMDGSFQKASKYKGAAPESSQSLQDWPGWRVGTFYPLRNSVFKLVLALPLSICLERIARGGDLGGTETKSGPWLVSCSGMWVLGDAKRSGCGANSRVCGGFGCSGFWVQDKFGSGLHGWLRPLLAHRWC